MPSRSSHVLETRTIDELTIRDERAFRHVPAYAALKDVLRRDGYAFRILPPDERGRSQRWDRSLFLNLTYWGAEGGDVLESPRIEADVVTHAAWHHLAARALAAPGRPPANGGKQTAEALLLGESVATAFDAYLVGRLLGRAPRSSFLATQVPAMAEAARAAGLSSAGFEALLRAMAADPERAFADLRELLSDAMRALTACKDGPAAFRVLADLDRRSFAPLLHHYELSNWILYARAYAASGPRGPRPDPRARAIERALRRAPDPLEWLMSNWVAPALAF
jgi:hypothetical protein